ncbi:LysR family transcriptional regulator [Marinobacterium sediminicola]|uniref:DNA-binding transcriptional regulator, LysR family n=1 Tax=Marinobacterium sediminicola TaxID=518898 RepID=A0ABY1S1X5_9GAMM|nr:LysR family transcriptional regulator [Marinobacterium sediminicola]ULG69539.1 LysR family transcriptional regulator [Marinobacterium sediminicola]SMR75692.1 DNA-binding transcriptional regulator, LysR family [Marinobacterium sediminicola]
MLSLRQLQVFLAVIETGSTIRAAEAVSLSQSAASNALSELESRLGERLFDRVGKRLVLNASGRALQPRARALLVQARDAEALFRDGGNQLKVGASTTIGNYLLPRLLGEARGELPCERVEIANTDDIAERMLRFELDLGLIEGRALHPDLVMTPWRQDEMVIVAAPSFKGQSLAHLPWIMREPGSGTRSVVEQELFGTLEGVQPILELGSSEAIHNAVRAGLGVSCLSRHVVQQSLQSGELQVLAPEHSIRRQLYLLRHRQRPDTAAVARFLACCPPES